ncbi:hypothetical protein BDW71DRAFT_142137 [Aspergillus fruticulosus]
MTNQGFDTNRCSLLIPTGSKLYRHGREHAAMRLGSYRWPLVAWIRRSLRQMFRRITPEPASLYRGLDDYLKRGSLHDSKYHAQPYCPKHREAPELKLMPTQRFHRRENALSDVLDEPWKSEPSDTELDGQPIAASTNIAERQAQPRPRSAVGWVIQGNLNPASGCLQAT